MTPMTRTCRFAWCTEETPVPARRSGAGTVHGGPECPISVGDDRLAVRVVGLPGFDVDEEVFVELTAAAERCEPTVLLLAGDEVDRLVTALLEARAVARA